MVQRADLPYCFGSTQVQDAFDYVDDLPLNGDWRPDGCKCGQPCQRVIYEYRGDTSDDRTEGDGRIKVSILHKVAGPWSWYEERLVVTLLTSHTLGQECGRLASHKNPSF